MFNLRTLALLALLSVAPLAAHADAITLSPDATSATLTASSEATQFGTPLFGDSASLQGSFIFSSHVIGGTQAFPPAPLSTSIPFADASLPTRAFTITGNTLQPYRAAVIAEAPPSALAPEPAGLFLLGTGAFATALSIRWRLFAL